ncbi:hypothetical protein FACS1894187_24620 [Synergistales bacterium]|nr:hypothetical protein FACS1894187_24620 [Synergistales bacterium]
MVFTMVYGRLALKSRLENNLKLHAVNLLEIIGVEFHIDFILKAFSVEKNVNFSPDKTGGKPN